MTVANGPATVSSIVPNSVSPVLKQLLKINIKNFNYDLVMTDLSVHVETVSKPSVIRQINVIEVGNGSGEKYVKVKFGGSESGIYNLFVTSRAFGRFDTRGITLTLIGKMTDFNPKRGSIHGGTLITIDGYHFSAEATDNPVRIGYTDCLVESTSEIQI